MRNLLFSILLLGGLLAGTVLVMQHLEHRQALRRGLQPLAAANNSNPSAGATNSPDQGRTPATNTEPLYNPSNTARTNTREPATNHRSGADSTNISKAPAPADPDKKSRTSVRKKPLTGGETGTIAVPHTPLLKAPSAGAAPVTLLYRGNNVLVTGKPVSNYLPCRALQSIGYVSVTAVEMTSRQESGRFRELASVPGTSSGRTALLGARHALLRGHRLTLVRLVFTELEISYSGWDRIRFSVGVEDIRNRPAQRPLSSAPYTRSISWNRLVSLCRKYLSGRGAITRLSDTEFAWVTPEGSSLLVTRKGRRWFLKRIRLRMNKLP